MKPLWIHVGGWPPGGSPQSASQAKAVDGAAVGAERPLDPGAGTMAGRRPPRPVRTANTRSARPSDAAAGAASH